MFFRGFLGAAAVIRATLEQIPLRQILLKSLAKAHTDWHHF
jgi:hypothetical protein